MPADDHIVADLDQIVDLGTFPEHRVPVGPPVNGRPRAYFNIVLDDHAANLGDLKMTAGAHHVTEPILPDPTAGMHDHPIADQAMADTGSGSNAAFTADPHPRTDDRRCADPCSGADFGARADHG